MGNPVKLDPRAFARGVDEVVQMKPIRRFIGQILHQKLLSKDYKVVTFKKSGRTPSRPKQTSVDVRRSG
ncbi:MAG: hypothetical protein GDA53_04560 [Rhodobacteraceae bacterium]|nr:hypothetical protein [Paracoccaceae bacterium]